jgi:hypothetical protein
MNKIFYAVHLEKCLYGDEIDYEIGDLTDQTTHFPVQPKLFTYARYNAELSRNGLDKIGLPNINPKHVQMLDSVDHIAKLQQVGRAIARNVSQEHFKGFL